MQQYKIFHHIYKKNKKTALFLIGDPKQAIYSFRGADVFSYLYIKSKIKKRYYLDINWRSSVNMCKSINLLLSRNNNPFLLKSIPFTPINHSLKNSNMNFSIQNITQTPITLFFNEKNEISLEEYQIWISKQCANEIHAWLNYAKKGEAIITTRTEKRILKKKDIAILVRNKKEAYLIQEELNKKNIISIYSSSRKSVFQTIDAQELLYILKSILEPTNQKLLEQSRSTDILQNLFFIEKNKLKNKDLYFVIERLYEYYEIWEKTGVFHMIKKIILDYQKNFNFFEKKIDYQKNINFLHIGELLEKKFQNFCKKKSLIYWFEKKISDQTQPIYSEYIRYLEESEAVKIITIHKSKGLEYPIVWIPFASDFHESQHHIYHDKRSFKIFFDIKQNNESLIMSDEERLGEDVRLLYVALTRTLLHCSIGIACLVKKKVRNRKNSDLHKSALGYIIQNKKEMNHSDLSIILNQLTNNALIAIKSETIKLQSFTNEKYIYLVSEYNFLNKEIYDNWSITSFTKLNKENKSFINNYKEIISKKNFIENQTKKQLTVHNFPIGKESGLLIHYILKNIHVINQKNYDWFHNILEKHNFPIKWTPLIISWTNHILNTSLNNKEIILSKLKKHTYVIELEFFLPIKNVLCNKTFNKIIRSYDELSMCSPKFLFNPITGILKGFIDLVFLWEKKYYIVDYKSNWIGEDNSFYSKKNIKNEMIKNRYDIQYQIYTIAIHKFLKNKVKNYNYKENFGGVFYIFLRAMTNEKNSGIFHTIPNYHLIEKLIRLIS